MAIEYPERPAPTYAKTRNPADMRVVDIILERPGNTQEIIDNQTYVTAMTGSETVYGQSTPHVYLPNNVVELRPIEPATTPAATTEVAS